MNNINFDSPTIVLMFSGGLDSLGALHELLNNPRYADQYIHTHHIHIKNVENRATAEAVAVNKIRSFYSNSDFRPFTHSESSIEFPTCNSNFLYDSDIHNFFGGYIAAGCPNVTYIAHGVTATDKEIGVGSDMIRARSIFGSFAPVEKKLYPVEHLTKQQIWDMLPDELRKAAWSCRTPIYAANRIIPCAKCKTCVAVRSLIKPDFSHN